MEATQNGGGFQKFGSFISTELDFYLHRLRKPSWVKRNGINSNPIQPQARTLT